MKNYRLHSKIKSINALSPTVKEIIIEVPTEFKYREGMFVSLFFPGNDNNKQIARSYSIASSYEETKRSNAIYLCVKNVLNGTISPILCQKEVGDILKLMGPQGSFCISNKKKPIVFIATGTGIAPLRAMIYYLLETISSSHSIQVIIGARYEEELLYLKEWQNLSEKYSNFHYYTVVSQPKTNNQFDQKGHVQDCLNILFSQDNNMKNKDYYICGLEKMIHDVEQTLLKKDINKKNIFFEKYD